MKFLFYNKENITKKIFILRLTLLIIVFFYSFGVIKLTINGFNDPDIPFSFLHNVDLIFHEAGHLIFSFFGDLIAALGGTMMQLLIPMICMYVLLVKSKDPFGGSICFWWIGENFLDISIYMNDAERMWLPLLGGRFGHSSPYGVHDWNYILNELNVLEYCQIFSKAVFVFGLLIMIVSMIWALILLINHYNLIKKLAKYK
jgi:hypothetical protein